MLPCRRVERTTIKPISKYDLLKVPTISHVSRARSCRVRPESPDALFRPPPSLYSCRYARPPEGFKTCMSSCALSFWVASYIFFFEVSRLARHAPVAALQVSRWQIRGLATPSEPYDAVVIGGGKHTDMSYTPSFLHRVGPGGYVAAIKAAQLGLKVRTIVAFSSRIYTYGRRRRAMRNAEPLAEHV